jgi:branched-chain amino acid transport system substrate-binding protein
LIIRLKQDGIGLVYIGGYYADAGIMEREGAAQGYHPQYFGEDAMATDQLWQIAGPAAQGMLFTFSPPAEKSPSAATVVKELSAKGLKPSGYLLYSYATIQVWVEAAKKAHSIKPLVVAKVRGAKVWVDLCRHQIGRHHNAQKMAVFRR